MSATPETRRCIGCGKEMWVMLVLGCDRCWSCERAVSDMALSDAIPSDEPVTLVPNTDD